VVENNNNGNNWQGIKSPKYISISIPEKQTTQSKRKPKETFLQRRHTDG